MHGVLPVTGTPAKASILVISLTPSSINRLSLGLGKNPMGLKIGQMGGN